MFSRANYGEKIGKVGDNIGIASGNGETKGGEMNKKRVRKKLTITQNLIKYFAWGAKLLLKKHEVAPADSSLGAHYAF